MPVAHFVDREVVTIPIESIIFAAYADILASINLSSGRKEETSNLKKDVHRLQQKSVSLTDETEHHRTLRNKKNNYLFKADDPK